MTDSILDHRPVAGARADAPDTTTDAPATAASHSEPPPVVVGRAEGPMLFDKDKRLICVKQLPLPGIVIFVHGVNSEGEWYKASEEGLCKGLNRRLGRLDDQMTYHGVDAGQLTPVKYTESVTPEGFLNPDLLPDNYVIPDPSFSPVIHFRWGYRATLEELKEYGDKIFLNEKDYWGGGPFTNGCSSLPDLWHGGLDDRAVGWITVQGINPTNRPLYRAPPRAYGVLAALRLAKLIESIRKMRADVPITVVCHSQGNIVGLTGAFFGDAFPEVEDPWGRKGRCVADAYVLANAPYSLANSEGPHKSDTFMDTWSQRATKDAEGKRGRQTYAARTQTLRTFLSMIGDRAAHEPSPDTVDADMANNRVSPTSNKSYTALADRARHGLNGSTYGRVTAYCCPHDQVISAITVQGIGWRGIDKHELTDIGVHGVLTQRVFASGFDVGVQKRYRYWEDDWRYGKKGTKRGFWYPPSPPAKFNLIGALKGNESVWGMAATLFSAPIMFVATGFSSAMNMFRVNADPPKGWEVLADAPALDETFPPQALRFDKPILTEDGEATSAFNEDNDPPSAWRDAGKIDAAKRADDPYDQYKAKNKDGDAHGTAASEAGQRYEDRALMRMEARRTLNTEWLDSDGHVIGEDGKSALPDGYKEWRDKQIVDWLDRGTTNSPTNHSTTMTNPEHAEKALAYDVAIGPCYLTPDQMYDLRIEADWRMGDGIPDGHPNKKYTQYFMLGVIDDVSMQEWVHADNSEGKIPTKIVDEREGQIYLNAGGPL
uniref:T6SS effector phospholipase Tle3 domain-containing protein n=1 Tax=Burkholderia cepacia TaxID=292 RepID=UPI00384ED84A